MAFRRDPNGPAPEVTSSDPFVRFIEVHAALEDARRFYEDKASIRFAAAILVTVPGDARTLATAIRSGQRALRSRLGPFSGIRPPVLLVLAAVLHRRDDDPSAFVSGLHATRSRFRRQGLRRSAVYETFTYAVLRGQVRQGPVTDIAIRRVHTLYTVLRRHHYVLTGPEDLPACALLAGLAGSPELIGSRTEALYRSLRSVAGWWPGESLQTAAHLLALSTIDAAIMATRAHSLVQALRHGGYRVRGRDYDELALLCMIAVPVERIASTVLETSMAIKTKLHLWGRDAFSLAVSITFVRLLQGHDGLERLSEVKLLLDMQAIMAAGGSGSSM